MADKPIHSPIVVLDPNGDVTVHASADAVEAALQPLGTEAIDHGAYDAMGDRLSVEIRRVPVDPEAGPRRPTRRALLLGRLPSAGPTETQVSVRKDADAPPAEPWVKDCVVDALVEAGTEEHELEGLTFRRLADLARTRLGAE